MIRTSRLLSAAITVAILAAYNAHAQEWPAKTVRIINPASAGGVSDVMGRTLAQHFTTTFGQNFVIDNRPGANHKGSCPGITSKSYSSGV